MTYLLDTCVLIDVLNDRKGRPQLLAEISRNDILLACCAVNVTEVYMGMRPSEEAKTGKLLKSLEFYPVTWEVAQLAGELFRQCRQKGKTLSYADVTIAAVALFHKLTISRIFRWRSCRSSSCLPSTRPSSSSYSSSRALFQKISTGGHSICRCETCSAGTSARGFRL